MLLVLLVAHAFRRYLLCVYHDQRNVGLCVSKAKLLECSPPKPNPMRPVTNRSRTGWASAQPRISRKMFSGAAANPRRGIVRDEATTSSMRPGGDGPTRRPTSTAWSNAAPPCSPKSSLSSLLREALRFESLHLMASPVSLARVCDAVLRSPSAAAPSTSACTSSFASAAAGKDAAEGEGLTDLAELQHEFWARVGEQLSKFASTTFTKHEHTSQLIELLCGVRHWGRATSHASSTADSALAGSDSAAVVVSRGLYNCLSKLHIRSAMELAERRPDIFEWFLPAGGAGEEDEDRDSRIGNRFANTVTSSCGRKNVTSWSCSTSSSPTNVVLLRVLRFMASAGIEHEVKLTTVTKVAAARGSLQLLTGRERVEVMAHLTRIPRLGRELHMFIRAVLTPPVSIPAASCFSTDASWRLPRLFTIHDELSIVQSCAKLRVFPRAFFTKRLQLFRKDALGGPEDLIPCVQTADQTQMQEGQRKNASVLLSPRDQVFLLQALGRLCLRPGGEFLSALLDKIHASGIALRYPSLVAYELFRLDLWHEALFEQILLAQPDASEKQEGGVNSSFFAAGATAKAKDNDDAAGEPRTLEDDDALRLEHEESNATPTARFRSTRRPVFGLKSASNLLLAMAYFSINSGPFAGQLFRDAQRVLAVPDSHIFGKDGSLVLLNSGGPSSILDAHTSRNNTAAAAALSKMKILEIALRTKFWQQQVPPLVYGWLKKVRFSGLAAPEFAYTNSEFQRDVKKHLDQVCCGTGRSEHNTTDPSSPSSAATYFESDYETDVTIGPWQIDFVVKSPAPLVTRHIALETQGQTHYYRLLAEAEPEDVAEDGADVDEFLRPRPDLLGAERTQQLEEEEERELRDRLDAGLERRKKAAKDHTNSMNPGGVPPPDLSLTDEELDARRKLDRIEEMRRKKKMKEQTHINEKDSAPASNKMIRGGERCRSPTAASVKRWHDIKAPMTASTKLKHVLLKHLGYELIHLPVSQWAQLRTTREKERYLRRKIQQHANKPL